MPPACASRGSSGAAHTQMHNSSTHHPSMGCIKPHTCPRAVERDVLTPMAAEVVVMRPPVCGGPAPSASPASERPQSGREIYEYYVLHYKVR